MSKYTVMMQGNLASIASILHEAIMSGGWSMSLVDENHVDIAGAQVYIRVYDKYFMRNAARASLTVVLAGDGAMVSVTAIGAGIGTDPASPAEDAEGHLVSIVEETLKGLPRSSADTHLNEG